MLPVACHHAPSPGISKIYYCTLFQAKIIPDLPHRQRIALLSLFLSFTNKNKCFSHHAVYILVLEAYPIHCPDRPRQFHRFFLQSGIHHEKNAYCHSTHRICRNSSLCQTATEKSPLQETLHLRKGSQVRTDDPETAGTKRKSPSARS